jgi:hypothetical protein
MRAKMRRYWLLASTVAMLLASNRRARDRQHLDFATELTRRTRVILNSGKQNRAARKWGLECDNMLFTMSIISVQKATAD